MRNCSGGSHTCIVLFQKWLKMGIMYVCWQQNWSSRTDLPISQWKFSFQITAKQTTTTTTKTDYCTSAFSLHENCQQWSRVINRESQSQTNPEGNGWNIFVMLFGKMLLFWHCCFSPAQASSQSSIPSLCRLSPWCQQWCKTCQDFRLRYVDLVQSLGWIPKMSPELFLCMWSADQ